MADIHIGVIEKESGSDNGKVQLLLHVPIQTPVAGVVPTPVSKLAGLDQAEVDSLANGSMVEMVKWIAVTPESTQEALVAKARTLFAECVSSSNSRYNFKYKFFGETLNASN